MIDDKFSDRFGVVLALVVIFILGIMWSLRGQEAYVVPLQVADSQQARKAWDELQIAKANWEDVRKRISEKYLTVDSKDPQASAQYYTPPGEEIITIGSAVGRMIIGCAGCSEHQLTKEEIAENGKSEKESRDREAKQRRIRIGWNDSSYNMIDPPPFDFSKDFKFIVPAKVEEKKILYPYLINADGTTSVWKSKGSGSQ